MLSAIVNHVLWCMPVVMVTLSLHSVCCMHCAMSLPLCSSQVCSAKEMNLALLEALDTEESLPVALKLLHPLKNGMFVCALHTCTECLGYVVQTLKVCAV